ncbi:thioesterase family protein [Microbacter sp. GSS18]|nr:thioesterase family protein [Microbacter sp. GSS18]
MSAIAGFRDAVALEPLGDDVFVARTQPVPWPKSYGGDLLAQAAAAAIRTVGPDRALHATHSLFVAPASIGAELRCEVERLRDGRSYSTRRVTLREGERVVLSAMLSFHVGEASPRRSAIAPPAGDPSTLEPAADRLAGVEDPGFVDYWARGRSFDIRHDGRALYAQPVGEPSGEMRLWLRSLEELGDDPDTHRLALVYACDYAMLEPALRAEGYAWTDAGLVTASLDHSLWFHEELRADRWLLCALRLVSHSHGRALVQGEFFAEDGTHVATVAQQGMIRRLAGSAH